VQRHLDVQQEEWLRGNCGATVGCKLVRMSETEL